MSCTTFAPRRGEAMTAFARISILLLSTLLTASAARAAAIDPDTPDYLRPIDNRAAIETERDPDGRLTVLVHGQQFDGRRFIASLMREWWRGEPLAGTDFDLHMEVAALGGHNGETLHNVDLVLARRGGRVTRFTLSADAGQNAPLRGALRTASGGRRFFHLESDDAGALLRFTDIFAHVAGGRAEITLDLLPDAAAKREGMLALHDIAILPEHLSKQIRESVGPPSPLPGTAFLHFSRLHARYALLPGKIIISDAALSNPSFAATLDGLIEGDNLNLRGYLLPLVLMQMQGLTCAERKSCLAALPFRVQGTLQAPQLQIMSYMDISHRHLFDEP
jgi:hypothetical protein